MSVPKTVSLDEDVLDSVERESQSRGVSLGKTINDLLRAALHNPELRRRTLEIKPFHMGYKPELNHDCVESLIEYGETDPNR